MSLKTALFAGLAPDGGLYVPESIEQWPTQEIARMASLTATDLGVRVLQPFTSGEIDDQTLTALVADAVNFPIPLVEIEPDVFGLELFHGPTLAFKDVGARVMARLMTALHEGGDPLTVLVATSGDTGSAVANAFHGVPHTRVAILYPCGRISPMQEAQLTMFNGAVDANVRAYAVKGSFDDCQRLVKEAFADARLRRLVRLTSANSINIGRLLPQMIYYFLAIAQLQRREAPSHLQPAFVSTPSGNFGNLTAGLMAKRIGLPIARFVAATTVNDVVPVYLATGRFEPRPSVQTLANAMDVGNPGNFERMVWLYGGPDQNGRRRDADTLEAMRRDVIGSRHDDDEVRTTIRQLYERSGYVLDPHSAIAYRGLVDRTSGASGPRVFLATAHPAKFAEIVEPVIGRALVKPPSLLDALARPRQTRTIDRTLDAVRTVITTGC